jgi:hypothetical protein
MDVGAPVVVMGEAAELAVVATAAVECVVLACAVLVVTAD